jgi:hypothetical protein
MSSDLATTTDTSGPRDWTAAATRLGAGSWIALTLTALGWFAFNTLRVEWGPIRHGVHFYEMAEVIAQPARLFNGLDVNRGGITTALFIVLCVAALMAPWLLSARRPRLAWLGWFAPLALMICVALVLKVRTSGDLFQETGWVDTLGHDVRHLANHVFRGAGAAAAQRVSLGAGGYLALLSSFCLAWLGVQRRL